MPLISLRTFSEEMQELADATTAGDGQTGVASPDQEGSDANGIAAIEQLDLEEPLLRQNSGRMPVLSSTEDGRWVIEEDAGLRHGCSSSAAIANLCNTIVGAGMMALPRVMLTLGLIGGTSVLAVVYCLAYYSMGAIIRAAEVTQRSSYTDMVRSQFGRRWETALQLAILGNNGGQMLIYINVLADSFADADAGLLPRLLPARIAGSVLLCKPAAALWVLLLVLLPLCCLRDMALLGRASGVSVAVAFSFGLICTCLASIAGARGLVADVRLLPSWEQLGGSWHAAVVAVLMTLPVTMLSFIGHFNLLPLKAQLEGYTQRKLLTITNTSLAITTSLYCAAGMGGYVLFGAATHENVLNNFTDKALAAVVGCQVAPALSVYVQLSYATVLCLTFPMLNFMLRDTVLDVLLGGHRPSRRGFYAITTVLLLFLYCIAMIMPSIWEVMQVLGATCGVLIAFWFPGLLILRVGPNMNKTRRVTAAYTMLSVGVLLALLVLLQPIIGSS